MARKYWSVGLRSPRRSPKISRNLRLPIAYLPGIVCLPFLLQAFSRQSNQSFLRLSELALTVGS
jgi:hypothetical protein